ncbi:endoplasmic reticulum junction formation protein lunapark [Trichoderma asperellum]|uniref:Endoplasmic reticulum junction formation protein lunapark n=1 Tax=Trichoderma asperellum TaxID=101201 RepID=A0A6V8QQY7_TRIAP|nr:endoplasmic reticulum junction formation protein lunapark [Trichoderma asperellum]
MGWLWPWKRSDPSPASFEKALSGLSKKIATTQSRLEWTRLRFRKIKVLGTLYTSFAYLVAVIVLLLVVGYPNLGPMDWTGMAGGPVFIYTTRVVITSYYTFRIENLEAKLKALQEERQDTIQKLKEATKYESTLELLEKYGGAEGKDGKPQIKIKEEAPQQQQQTGFTLPERTHIAPPATANIPRRDLSPASFASSRPVTPLTQSVTSNDEPSAIGQHLLRPQSAQSQHHSFPPPQAVAEPHWYDRIFDVLLGEDETAAKNRIVLICQVCRLVNGQAPPGTKSLSELGMWKCMACGSRNGEMDEGKRIVREVLKSQAKKGGKAAAAKEEPSTTATAATTLVTDLGDDQAEPETSTESQPTTPLSATSQPPSPLEGNPAATVRPRRSARNKRS